MLKIMIIIFVAWVVIALVFWWLNHLRINTDYFVKYITTCTAFAAIIISIANYYNSFEIQKDQIVPKIQAKPISIEERINYYAIIMDVLNYSEYTASNIYIDIKVGDCAWVREVWKASGKDTNLWGEYLNSPDIKRIREDYHNLPILDTLKQGKGAVVHFGAEKRAWISKLNLFHQDSDGTSRPLSEEEMQSNLQRVVDWSGEIEKACNGHPVDILVRTLFENEIGQKFDDVNVYKLICTVVGTGRNYTFIPTGKTTLPSGFQ